MIKPTAQIIEVAATIWNAPFSFREYQLSPDSGLRGGEATGELLSAAMVSLGLRFATVGMLTTMPGKQASADDGGFGPTAIAKALEHRSGVYLASLGPGWTRSAPEEMRAIGSVRQK
jgi:hypothetical protein